MISHKKTKILFVLKDRNISYGKISFGLTNSAQFVANALNDMGRNYEAKVICVVDGNAIDKEVHAYKPNIVILEAYWCPPYKVEELVKLHSKVFWTVRSHSKTLFFSNEGIFMEWTKKYAEIAKKHKNLLLSCNSKEFKHEFKQTLDIDMDYLPNIYAPKDYGHKVVKDCFDDVLEVGLFCSIRPLKNLVIQAMAAISFANLIGKKLKVYINAGRVEQSGNPVLKNLIALFEGTKHELVQLDWLNHDDFIGLVKRMDLMLAASLTETFSIVAADGVANNIPTIGCPEIEWMDPIFQADPLNFNDIQAKIIKAYYGKNVNLQKLNLKGLLKHNLMACQTWADWATIRG